MKTATTMALLLTLGCGGSDGDGGSTCPAAPNGDGAGDLFPLALGTRWEYRNVDAEGCEETLVKEIGSTCVDAEVRNCDTEEVCTYSTYVQTTEVDPVAAPCGMGAAINDDSQVLYMRRVPEGVVRVKQDFMDGAILDHWVGYAPYFMRLFAEPHSAGRDENYTHVRCEYDETGLRNRTVRRYRHRVMGEERITVPAGTYDTILVERVDMGDGDTKRYWYAEGVGKVREHEILAGGSVGAAEELTSYTAGSGSCP